MGDRDHDPGRESRLRTSSRMDASQPPRARCVLLVGVHPRGRQGYRPRLGSQIPAPHRQARSPVGPGRRDTQRHCRIHGSAVFHGATPAGEGAQPASAMGRPLVARGGRTSDKNEPGYRLVGREGVRGPRVRDGGPRLLQRPCSPRPAQHAHPDHCRDSPARRLPPAVPCFPTHRAVQWPGGWCGRHEPSTYFSSHA